MKNYFFILLLFLLSCQEKPTQKKVKGTPGKPVDITYAKGFSIEQHEGFKILKVHSPKDTTLSYTYLLINSQKPTKIPQNVDYDYKVKIPLKKVVVTSTTHLPPLVSLQVEKTLVGFPHLNFISSPEIQDRIKKHKIAELGENENLNFEVLISLQPNAVIGFSIESNEVYGTLSKIGIPILYNMDWQEENPLGKAEWIKFFGALYDQTEKADRIFAQIENNYNAVKKLVTEDLDRPTVISGELYKDVWYAPGGESWGARFIEDAGGDYIYKNTKDTGSLSLSLESVLNAAKDADIWINPGEYTQRKQLQNRSEHYTQLKAFRKGNIYGYAGRKGDTGGLLYFEKGPSRPDLILKDLIHIFHPNLLPKDYKPAFYRVLQ